MKAYFVINEKVYTEDATTVLIFLNKLSKGRGATFAEGWYMKLANPAIPESEKTFKKLCKAFEEAFVPKDLKTELVKQSTPSAWTNLKGTLTNTPPPSN